MPRDNSHLKKVFTRCIAAKPRVCSQCEDLAADEGEIYFKDKTAQVWCIDCRDYDDARIEAENPKG